ncbi:MAG TPA: hypothetical protein VE996_08290 [Terriglobales bacterium]|nr:hypothetical protein [Terriglobales bacterium]
MIQGYVSVPIERFGGLVTSWPEAMLDVSLASRAENVRFTQSEVGSREGLTRIAALGAPVQGLGEFVPAGGSTTPVAFDANGKLWLEQPAGSGVFVAAVNGLVTPPAGARMRAAAAYGRLYAAFGDGRQGVGAPAAFDGTNLDPVTTAAPATPPQPQDSINAGNVAAGQRYVVVLFKTRAGSLTAPSPPSSWTAAGGKQALIGNLPIGPSNVVARIVAFTVAGGSSDGPYFYIGESQSVNGVSETATVIDDNSTTSATFNFDDAFLSSSIDVTDQFRAIPLPEESGVFYSALTQRMVWWGEPGQPSLVRFSQPQDAGTYYGDTGFLLVSDGDGQAVTAVFELRDQLFVAKQDSLYVVTPNDGDPAAWDVLPVTNKIGIAGADALDLGNGFAVFAHPSGAYYFDGSQPQWISDELAGASADHPGFWQRINWAAAGPWVAIDVNAKEARFGVALDQAGAPSHILKLNYMDGWDRSFRFSAFTGRYHYFPGRRWSLDTIAAQVARLLDRPGASLPLTADRTLAARQLVLGSGAAEGDLVFVDPNATSDMAAPIASVLELGAVSSAEQTRMQRQGVELLGLIQIRARGAGSLQVEAGAGGAGWRPLAAVPLQDEASRDAQAFGGVAGEAVRLRLRSAGGAWRLLAAYAFMRPLWPLRPLAPGA